MHANPNGEWRRTGRSETPESYSTAHPMYHAWIDAQRLNVLPQRTLRNDSMHYYLQCSPRDYLRLSGR
jgi:hypothetical protein